MPPILIGFECLGTDQLYIGVWLNLGCSKKEEYELFLNKNSDKLARQLKDFQGNSP